MNKFNNNTSEWAEDTPEWVKDAYAQHKAEQEQERLREVMREDIQEWREIGLFSSFSDDFLEANYRSIITALENGDNLNELFAQLSERAPHHEGFIPPQPLVLK